MNDVESVKLKRNLTALVDFSRIINSSLDLQFILSNLLLTCMGKFFATRGLIALNINGIFFVRSSKGVNDSVLGLFPAITVNDINNHNGFSEFLTYNKFTAVETISSSNEVIGLVCLGEKLNKIAYTEDDLEFLRTIINISASAIQNSIVLDELKKVNRVLDMRVHRLNSLFELSKEFSLLSENSGVAKLLIYAVIGQFLVSKFAVVLSSNGVNHILESKFPEAELLEALIEVDCQSIETSLNKEEIACSNPKLEKLKIELVVPMQLQGETKGLILLGKRVNNSDYTGDDIEYIYSVGSLAIISLENRRLFSEALEKQKMEEELEIARDIQNNLLPHSLPKYYPRFDLAAYNIASKQVGGDFYDVIPLDDKSFCMAIADVSGKGVPAALLTANLQAFLKILCKRGMSLSEATAIINDLVTENTMDGKFITFFWGVLNDQDLTMNYVNAGHNPPLLVRNKKIIKLDRGGIILGVMKTFMTYESPTISLEKDDVIVLFTDGITEAMNKDGEEYSDEKLEALVLKYSDLNSSEICEIIRNSVFEHAAGTVQSDDITLLIVKVK